jgi:hypothetical protein
VNENQTSYHTLDKQKSKWMNISDLIICQDKAAPLQTLAEKIANTICRAAKVCSGAAYIMAG